MKLNRRDVLSGAAALAVAGSSSEAVFAAVDQMRPDYSLQKNIADLRIPSEVTVVGTGRFGAWVGLFAAISGVRSITLIDPGNVDSLDLACSPFQGKHVGASKPMALKQVILSFRPDAQISVHSVPFDESRAELLRGVVFNGASSQKLFDTLPSIAHKMGLIYAAGAYIGNQVIVTDKFQPKLKLAVPSNQPPVWVGSAALSALLAVQSAFVTPINFAGPISLINQEPDEISIHIEGAGSPNP